MTAAFQITEGERAWWQQQAAAELTAILAAHPGLPRISWTVGPAGRVLTGHVNGLVPAGQARGVFGSWRSALALEDYREHQAGTGTVYLHAASRRNQVMVRLTGTVFDESPA